MAFSQLFVLNLNIEIKETILFFSRNHYDLTKKIINCADDNKRNEYEIKADYLHRKMKTKAKQINKLKAIQQNKVLFHFFLLI